MRGYPEFNFPAFLSAAKHLRQRGYDVFSPAERDLNAGFNPKTDEAQSLAYYMAVDLPHVCEADAVALLAGWEDSEGTRIEVSVARQLGKPLFDAKTMRPILVEESVLDEAERLIHGERNDSYGDARDDFTRTGTMWGAILGVPVSAHQVALCMAALKISREAHKPARDNVVDGCGYLALAYDVIGAEGR